MATTGMVLPSLVNIAVSASEAVIISNSVQQKQLALGSSGPWSPPQWSKPAVTFLTVAATSNNSGQPSTPQMTYVFDAVFRLLHARRIHKTSHPVLTGANISDHAYNEPARVSLEIGMSDSMAAYTVGVWVGAATKSISAYQILKSLALNKTLIQLTSRLDIYQNMLITDISAPDDNKTKTSLRATINLEELLSASVTSVGTQSSRPQSTSDTSQGVVQGVPPNDSQIQQNQLPSPLYPNAQTYPSVPGAGSVSSNSLSQTVP